MHEAGLKPVSWIGSSYKDFRTFPADIQDVMGFALYRAQLGKKHESAKPLKGFGGASVIEIVADFRSDTFRAVYTVRFAGFVYVLHAFQKKSKKGIQTPTHEMEVIRKRLKMAERDHNSRKETDNAE
jgi:phage-related protein